MEVLNLAYNSITTDMENVDRYALCLWVLHADKIPPHIGVSSNNEFYSLKVNGKDEKVPVQSLLNTIKRKQIPTLCFEVDQRAYDLESIFEKYAVAVAGQTTCLAPIKELLEYDSVEKVSELIDQLDSDGRIRKVTELFLPKGFTGIPKYELVDIHARLKALEDVK